MIQYLSAVYHRAAAGFLFVICFYGMFLPSYAGARASFNYVVNNRFGLHTGNDKNSIYPGAPGVANLMNYDSVSLRPEEESINKNKTGLVAAKEIITDDEPTSGGPTQPEMTAFKSVGTNNMVNLFTGDFGYNIPLLDVGGYPVNIFYDGGISMEQEASWVGLGWNINPGNVSRNMRGIPDDFNGEEKLIQTQNIKPNLTWGVNLGADFELVGIKDNPFTGSLGGTLGISFNNYLGPALEVAIKGNTGLSLAKGNDAEKSAPRLGGSLSVNASSRTGVTFSPGISLTANAFKTDKGVAGGLGLQASTSYNSRTGIKSIQLSGQMSMNFGTEKNGVEGRGRFGSDLASTSISFTKPSYTPSLRMPVTNTAFSGRFQLGTGVFGIYPSLEVEVYKQKSEIADVDIIQQKPMVGYIYSENAAKNSNAVMDFNRINDNEVTPSTPIISAPQYSYDIFSIQGEGTGGSVRAYRNDDGYFRDNFTSSKDQNVSVGGDIGVPGHYGANFTIVKTPSTIGEWVAGNRIKTITTFKKASGSFENVYFRNPGETSVLNNAEYDRIGGTDLVRYALSGTKASPTVEPVLERFNNLNQPNGTINLATTAALTERKKRTQVFNFLNAEEASIVGLDKTIRIYNSTTPLNGSNYLSYTTIPRFDNVSRKKHHISEIDVLETSGQRYIYGLPVYNIVQKDFTFTVNSDTESPANSDKVNFANGEPTTLHEEDKDGYLQITETPAYAHSFLLTGLLSPDYVDLTGDGITDDDQGSAVKFNYTRMAEMSKWRTPLTPDNKANFNAGKLTERKDDKGVISYGERESWYVHSIESKTMIALFTLESRNDNKGSYDATTGINMSDQSSKRLKQIDLYSKSDLKKNGISGAKPIKTVHFEYNYELCKNVLNNSVSGDGKLTLKKIYFSFNGQVKSHKNQYVFSYGTTADENPDYAFNANDRWGTYKPSTLNPQGLKNSIYPYPVQDKTEIDKNAGAWLLKKILLPSGGQIEVNYESDDYAFVQNKRAAVMMNVLGFGSTTNSYSPNLYRLSGTAVIENNYAFIKVPEACSTAAQVQKKYLEGVSQLAFKMAVAMPKGTEYINSYATIDGDNYGVYTSDPSNTTIWVKLKLVDNKNPLSLTAIEFLREQLPGQAYPGYDVSESAGLKQVGDILAGWLDGLLSAFKNPVDHLRGKGLAQSVEVLKTFVRLNDPDGFKYGGGHRVKSVRLKDNWKEMNNQQAFTSVYGQDYDYTTTEVFNGVERTISSGVASYEPTFGGDENPFQTMIQVTNKVPLGPASYGAIEMPVLDAFFPSPLVGYSKVTVRAMNKNNPANQTKTRSGIGKQVTTFYTAKDFPVNYSYTTFDAGSDKQSTSSSFGLPFYKYSFDSRALSQGFKVEINDMHGKMKSQASYPENDEKTPVNYTENFYRNTGAKGLNEKFEFVNAATGGTVAEGNMGIDIELMTDTREFSVKGTSYELQGQVEMYPVGLTIWLPFIWGVAGNTENNYRAVTTTKVISYHSIVDNVIVIDKGSQVSTQNLVYDSETGDVIVNRTNNEFKRPVYNTNYPAWWAYSGMSNAYKNIGAIYSGVDIIDGKITTGNVPADILESGDELYIIDQGIAVTDCVGEDPNTGPATGNLIWAFNKNKNESSLTDPTPSFYFMDRNGELFNRKGVKFKIIRSGKRNMLSASLSSVMSMQHPVVEGVLNITNSSDVVNASASLYREKWQVDDGTIKRFNKTPSGDNCTIISSEDCDGVYLQEHINPYRTGLLGNFRAHETRVYYGSRAEQNPQAATNLPVNGYLQNFNLFWKFDVSNLLKPDETNAKWVSQSFMTKANAKGMQLETKNALNIYTSADYGFNKAIAKTMVNNSRYHEMIGEGFEDAGYNETLNDPGEAPLTCLKPKIEFAPNEDGYVDNITTSAVKPHTGKKLLKVAGTTYNTNAVAVKKLNSVNEDFPLVLEEETINSYVQGGSAVKQAGSLPANQPSPAPSFTYHSNNIGLYSRYEGPHTQPISVNNGGAYSSLEFTYVTTQYAEVTQPGTYTFSPFSQQTWELDPSNPGVTINVNHSTIIMTIYNENEQQIFQKIVRDNVTPQAGITFMNCGIYKITCSVQVDIQLNGNVPTIRDVINEAGYTSNLNTISTMLNNTVTCTYTKPIPGETSMLNTTFALEKGKRMYFSAWVNENCGTSTQPCNATTYTQSGIKIDFSNGSGNDITFTPKGPIIEGWQRMEGEFTVPDDSDNFSLVFNNGKGSPIYFDDIRIHPFNASMATYVYDPITLRLAAELDANNYAKLYEYDPEGTLIRTKVETKEGIKTVVETRSAKQKNITTIQ